MSLSYAIGCHTAKMASAEKQAFGAGLIGAALGAAGAPANHGMEGAGRGFLSGAGVDIGAGVGGALGSAALMPSMDQIVEHMMRTGGRGPKGVLTRSLLGLLGGGALGGYAGYKGVQGLLGKPSWQQPQVPHA